MGKNEEAWSPVGDALAFEEAFVASVRSRAADEASPQLVLDSISRELQVLKAQAGIQKWMLHAMERGLQRARQDLVS